MQLLLCSNLASNVRLEPNNQTGFFLILVEKQLSWYINRKEKVNLFFKRWLPLLVEGQHCFYCWPLKCQITPSGRYITSKYPAYQKCAIYQVFDRHEHPYDCRERVARNKGYFLAIHVAIAKPQYALNDRGYSFERSCVLRRWESETLK